MARNTPKSTGKIRPAPMTASMRAALERSSKGTGFARRRKKETKEQERARLRRVKSTVINRKFAL